MKKLLVFTLAVLAAGTFVVQGHGQRPAQLSEFMRRKLSYSQKVLEGIVVKDFDMIGKNGQALSLMSLDASWNVIQTAEYFQRSNEFQRTANSLDRMSRDKNLDGAALTYVRLTTQCFDCHKYVRDRSADK